MKTSKISLIQTAQHRDHTISTTYANLVEHLTPVAKSANVSFETLVETVTQVLANFAAKASEGQPIVALSDINSLSAFLAGVEAIANNLPKTQNQQTKTLALQILNTIAIGQDQKVTPSALSPIIGQGAKYPDLVNNYKRVVQTYFTSLDQNRPNGAELVKAVKALQQNIDTAMRTVQAAGNKPSNGQPPAGGGGQNPAGGAAMQQQLSRNQTAKYNNPTQGRPAAAGPAQAGSTPSGGSV